MGLQIRVRHALGERVIELPDRTIDEPLVVGRATNAEIQVPSVNVSTKHCVLFIHEGHWAVQDLGAGAGTYVNGEPVQGARFLQIGDTISIGPGSGAPVIEVDPAAAAEGRHGFAGTGLSHMQAAAAAPAYGGYAASAPVYTSAAYGAPVPAQSYSDQHEAGDHHPAVQHDDRGHHDTDQISFESGSSAPYTGRRYRANRQSSGGAVTVMIVAALLIGGVIWYVVANRPQGTQQVNRTVIIEKPTPQSKGLPPEVSGTSPKPTAPIPSSTPPATGASGSTNSQTSGTVNGVAVRKMEPGVVLPPSRGNPGTITPSSTSDTEPGMDPVRKPSGTTGNDPVRKPAGSVDEGMDPVRKPAVGNDEGMDPIKKPAGGSAGETEPGMDPIKKPAAPAAPTGPDPETMDAVAANSFDVMKKLAEQPGKESFAVLRFEDFKRLNPGKHDAEIDKFIDQKMDRIWWERIDQLLNKIKTLETESTDIRLKVVDETDPDRKKKMLDGYKKMEADKAAANKELRERMKFDGSEPPPLSDASALAALAAKRDKTFYEGWKRATINYIKSNQGKLAWMGE